MNRSLDRRRIWMLAGPVILSNITVPLIGLVDTTVMGHMPDATYLGAVSAGATIFSILFFLFNFLRTGITGFTAQAFGQLNEQAMCHTFWRGVLIAVVLGVLIILVQNILIMFCHVLIDAGQAVKDMAADYMAVRVWSAPLTLINLVITGYLIGIQRTDLTLYHQLLVNILNVVLNLLFVFGLGMDVEGVALATVLAETTGFGFGFLLLYHACPRNFFNVSFDRLFLKTELLRLMVVNRDFFIRSLALQTTFLTFMAVGSRFGEVSFAANAVLLNFLMIAAFSADGFAHAAETLVGHAVGAKDETVLKKTIRLSFEPTLFMSLAIALAYMVFGGVFIDAMTSIDSVRDEARLYVPLVAVLTVVSVPAFILDGVFFGATRGADIRIAMLQASGVFFTSVAIFTLIWDNHGLWMAMILMNIMRGVFLWRRFGNVLADVRGSVLPS